MADQAPVCHVSEDQVIEQPPVKQLPALPQADPNDPNSMAAAINALRLYVMQLAGQSGGQGPRGATGQPGKPAPKPQTGRFSEVARATREVKIPIDDTSDPPSVTVSRINSLTMRDNVTGEVWTWTL